MAVLETDLILNDKGFTQGIAKAQTALQKLPNASNQATNSLMNLSRVAQDAPYGFIGIANNINPLLESFQRLKETTGSTGTALKSLVSGMMGPAGLGLAVGVVSSLLVVFSQRSSKAKDSTNELSEAAKQAKRDQEEFQSAIDAASKSVISQARDIDELRSILISTNNATNQLTQSTINQGLARFLFDQKNTELQKVLSAEIEKQLILRKRFVGISGLPEFKEDPELDRLKKIREARLRVGAPTNDLDRDIKRIEELNAVIFESGGSVNLINAVSKGFENLFKSFVDKNNSLKNTSNGIKEVISDMLTLDQLLNRVSNAPKQGPINDAIERFYSSKPFTISPDKFNIGKPDVKAPKGLIPQETIKATDNQLQFIARTVGNVLQPAFAGLFDALEEGGDVVKSFFDGFIDGIKRMIEQLLATAAISGILALITGGSFNSIFSGAIGLSPKKRAAGGPVSGGLPYLVGENAPELFVPSTSGRIVPMNNLGGITGGAMQMVMVTVDGRISGRNLELVTTRQQRYRLGNG